MSNPKLSDIFNVSYGTKLDMNKMTQVTDDQVAFVSRSSKNNGVVGSVDRIDGVEPVEGGSISVTLGGTYVLSSFLQERPFYTAQNVAVLTPKEPMSREKKLYYCMCITKNRFRYSAFGREANRTLKDLVVPSIESIPTWIEAIDFNKFDNASQRILQKELDVPKIEEFSTINELFLVKNGIAATGLIEKEERFSNSVMYVRPASTHLRTRRSYISKEQVADNQIYPKGTLFVSTNGEGSHTYSYVSTEDFVPNSDVSVLIPKDNISLEAKLFYAKCITANRYLFSYGRKPKGDKLKNISIPKITSKNESEIKRFIQSLKYSEISLAKSS